MKLQVALISASLLFFPATGNADGNDLLRNCQSASSIMDGGKKTDTKYQEGLVCLAYLEGVLRMNDIYSAYLKNSKAGLKPFFCLPPKGISTGQAARIVTDYLRRHPKELNESHTPLVVRALLEKFACPK